MRPAVSTMVCCVAWGCSNRSEKGVRMYGFPTDAERRKKWLAQVSRRNFTITKDYNNKKICEAHFEADQFVKTKKGKTRLRADAVPTIFVHRPVVKKRRAPAPRCTPGPVNIERIAADHSYSVKGDTALRTCSITDAPSHSSPAASLVLQHTAPSAPTVLQLPSPFVINPKSDELQHNIDRMPSNVEIKAAVRNMTFLIQRAEELSRSEGTLIRQQDTFFNVQKGRLKLRNLMDGTGQLIFYERPDVDGPKLSNYSISLTNDPDGLTRVLSDALGVKGVVKKERHLYMVGQTRVHVDTVEGLGHFMELEVVMKDGQSAEEGEAIAHHLMEELGVNKEDLIVGAYMDLLLSDKKG